ncbi:MAG: hypothetical protein GTO18_05630 [Anaerolineales bacterium]|nr:hypothetical protein [Anaerolineales bacterium]
MAKVIFTIPALYGDHHTTEVHNILDSIEGVKSVFVSAAFRQVEIEFDKKVTSEGAVKEALAKQGYVEGTIEEVFPESPSVHATRHSAAVAETHTFVEEAPTWHEGRPLWPCPGFEYQPQMED